jgi:hypothetical protein
MSTSPTRARTIPELFERMSRMISEEGMQRALAFRPRPTDVIVTPFAKSGTTWVQQIVHGLRTRGSMEFSEITEVIPWLEIAYDMGIDPERAQPGAPRAYKSHLPWELVPKGARYIYVVRDPGDIAVSFHHFLSGWFFEPGSISLPELTRAWLLGSEGPRRYWPHVVSWWQHREDENVLFLCYENMKRDLSRTVARIADFIGIPLDDELRDIVVRQSSIGFMRANGQHFDDHLIKETRNAACGLPPGGDSSKVRSGNVGDHEHELPPDLIAALDRVLADEIEKRIGFPSYAALRDSIPV